MVSKKVLSALAATTAIVSILETSGVAFAQAPATATASVKRGFLGLPGFEVVYAVAGLAAAVYLALRRRK